MPTTPAKPDHRSPWRTLTVGVVLALCTIGGIGAYTHAEVRRLRDEQTAISERNRKDSLQLLRIQNDLGSMAALMRDMTDGVEPYPLSGWAAAFDRLRGDLAEATTLEQRLAPAVREPAQQARLLQSLDTYWVELARMFEVSRTDEAEARRIIRTSLIPQHRAIDGLVSQFLIVNNRVQEDAVLANRAIYDRVAREILMLVAVLMLVTAGVGAWVVLSNRRAFQEVADVSAQLRTLSRRMLRLQEDVQRSLSRELHDDFGQIVTAVGTLLGRAQRHAPAGGPLGAELEQVRAIAQQALDRIRSRSQWLHPGVLDDFGLERALERCVEQFERQTGIHTRLDAEGAVHVVSDERAIHVYRIAQEALNNVARHSGAAEAWVRISDVGGRLELEIEDHGRGIAEPGRQLEAERGMGLVSMRERAELIGGELHVRPRPQGGTIVRLVIPSRDEVVAARGEVA